MGVMRSLAGDGCSILALFIFFFNDTATTEIYTLSLHDALPIWKNSSVAICPSLPRNATCGPWRSSLSSTSAHPTSWAGTDPTVPGTPVYRPEIGRQHGRTTSFGSPVLLRQDPEAELERSGDTLSQTTDSVARRPEPGGGPAVDRVRRQPAAPRLAADAVRDRATTRRTGAVESE